MILEDFTMLGKTVPTPTRDGARVHVCCAGVSRELGSLVRIYPLGMMAAPADWQTCTVVLERSKTDSRSESWKLAGAADRLPEKHRWINFRKFTITGEVPKKDRGDLLKPHFVESIKEANARHASLAILHPTDWPELTFDHNPDSPDSPQLSLFNAKAHVVEAGAKRFAFNPRLRFRDEAGEHHLQLREWGCFMFMRKYGDARRHELPDALHLSAASSLLVGNFAQHRTAWCVIKVLNGLRAAREPDRLFQVEAGA